MGRLTPAAVFVLAFAAYAATAYPSFAPRDSADLARAAITLGVAHPPGYPLYALLGHAWLKLLPWGDAVYRLNLLSAACGALAAALLAAACRRHGRAAAWAAGLSFAFCAPLWKFSLLSEMYSLQAAFAAALLLVSEGDRGAFSRRAALAGLLFGLGCVNHQSFILTAPIWLWLWRGQARRHGLPLSQALSAALPFSAGGLLLYAAVPILLGDARLGLAVLLRAEYGTFTLSSGFARPLSQAGAGLMGHFAAGLATASSPLAAAAALGGLWALRGSPRRGAILLGLGCGAGFVLLSRFDVSQWLARTVLETSFVLPVFWLCAAAGAFVGAVEEERPLLAAGLAAALALWPLAAHARLCDHRDDFSAWDYARNLRRTLPPGSAAVVRGDTALFSLKLTAPDREIISDLEDDVPAWLAARGREDRPLFAVGVPSESMMDFARRSPAGLALSLDGRSPPDLWPLYAIRRGRALDARESYARDPALSYAFAHAAAERFEESAGRDGTAHALSAAAWDPEDFRLRFEP